MKCSECEHLYCAKEFGVYTCSKVVKETGFTAPIHPDNIDKEQEWCPLKEIPIEMEIK